MGAKKNMTWQELKDFCNSLPEEVLRYPVTVQSDDNGYAIAGAEQNEVDIYYNPQDADDNGTAEILEEAHEGEEDFSLDNYEVFRKGTPYLYDYHVAEEIEDNINPNSYEAQGRPY